MARVFLIGLEGMIDSEIAEAVSREQHTVFRRSHSIEMSELLGRESFSPGEAHRPEFLCCVGFGCRSPLCLSWSSQKTSK
jgi:hypothetical protein